MHMILMKTFSCQWKVPGNSLVAQWLGLGAFATRIQVQALVRELRFCKNRGAAESISQQIKIKSSRKG